MPTDFVINRGDTFPPLEAVLEKRNKTTLKWEPLDLTEAETVTLYMQSTEPAQLQVYGTCTIASERKSGAVEYPWGATDTELANTYRAQFEILWKNGKRQTVPNRDYLVVEIQPDLAEDA
jgi:hypothetical protein